MSAVVTGPFQHVSAASVSLLKGGDWHLLMRTAEGQVQCIVPAHIARGFLRLTNPPCVSPPVKEHPITRSKIEDHGLPISRLAPGSR